ncbi:MAG: FecR domain-containing protein [Rikenellaceae bacterium]|nr:FecR domain-containing protein [Rikenellaceae bacterium]
MNNEWQQSENRSLEWIWEHTLDVEGEWNAHGASNRMWQHLQRRRWMHRITISATAVAALLAIGLLLIWPNRFEPSTPPVRQFVATTGIQLAVDEDFIAELPAESSLRGDCQTLEVISEATDSMAYRIEVRPMQYATLTVPPGHRYSLTLSDGSCVTLNADSRLRYPVEFADSVRQVELCGEAMFEVTADRMRPFRVITEHGVQTQVLGTQFNVTAYPETPCAVTLLDGAVRVLSQCDTCRLLPGQQARVVEEGFDVRWVDTKMSTAWFGESISCDNEPLSVLARKISRQYNTEIYIGDPLIEDVTFYGYLPHSLSLEQIFKVLNQSEGIRVRKIDDGYLLYQ